MFAENFSKIILYLNMIAQTKTILREMVTS